MNRRNFLKSTAALSVALSLGDVHAEERQTDIAVINTKQLELGVRRAVELLGGIERFVKKGQNVVIKPNMSFSSGIDTAANTNPVVVATVVAMCKEAGAKKISVLDNTLQNAEGCLRESGIRDSCNSIVSDCVHVVKDERFFREVSIKGAVQLKSTKAVVEALDADVLIACPKAKSHGGAGMTATMKGMMGLIYNRSYFHMSNLFECIADLYSVLKPALTVLDATKIMTTGGPGGPGNVIEYNDIIASADGVAADAYAAAAYEWYGKKVTPSNVGYLKAAAARKLGRIDLENLSIIKQTI
jgi:uncharacterized protein (DUF362 family)